MINLYSQNILVTAPDGTDATFDLEKLQHDLLRSFAAAGVHEKWLPEHIAAVVEEQLHQESQKLTGPQVDKLIVKLLIDAGYPDVSAQFAGLRGVAEPGSTSLCRTAWQAERVRELLHAQLPISQSAARELAGQVLQKLGLLAFPKVTDELIKQLGQHVLEDQAKVLRDGITHQPAGRTASGWLMPPGYWEAFFNDDTARLLSQRILLIYPVSRLFPTVRITLDTLQLARQLAGGRELTELAFTPHLRSSIQVARHAVELLREHTVQLAPDAARQPAYLLVAGLPAVVRQNLRIRRKAEISRHLQEMRGVIHRAVGNVDHATLILSFC